MKYIVVFLFGALPQIVFGQMLQKLKPFDEARKVIASVENAEEIREARRNRYEGRWTLDLTYGQRFVSPYNKSNQGDSVELVDFSGKRAYYGVGSQYFISRNLSVGIGVEFLFLPKNQTVTFAGNGGSGEGSGGLLFSTYMAGKYFVVNGKHTRLYTSLALGRDQMVVKGGNVEVSFSTGRNEDIETITRSVFGATLSAGVTHRLSPAGMIDFMFGYSNTSQSDPIGGITSPGGIKTSVSFQFILNPKKGG